VLAFAVAAERASACVCANDHPAARLAFAPAAIVGVVEEVSTGNGGSTHVIQVERAVKGNLSGRVSVHSAMTSCMVTLERGARVGLVLSMGGIGWDVIACNVFDPDTLIAAGTLPQPRGAPRFVAAVEATGLDSVALGARGRAAGYGLPQGTPLAVARCGGDVVQAARSGGKVRVFTRFLPRLNGALPQEVPVREVLALGCVGRVTWIAGRDELVSLRPGEPPRVELRRRTSAAAIVGSRAYLAHGDRLRAVNLTGAMRTTRYDGAFTQLSVHGNRVAGRLRDGRAAVLNLTSGRLVAGRRGPLAWLGRDRLLNAGAVLDTRLRLVRRVQTRGDLLTVEDGAAYFADGAVIRQLAAGARRAETFARLPGNVIGLTAVQPTAAASGTLVNRVPICP
jgi:hypothetical protein